MESLQVGGGGQSVLGAIGGRQRLKSVSHTYIQGERAQQQVDSPEEFLMRRARSEDKKGLNLFL